MRIAQIGKKKATIVDIDIQSLKMGQTEVVPAVALHIKVVQANDSLNQLDKTLLHFLYAKASGKPEQATLDGVSVVSEMPALTDAALALGALNWEGEQTGTELKIYQGITGDQDIKLRNGTVRKIKIDPKEGGAVEWHYWFFTSDVDQDTLGALAILKSLERDIELVPPEALSSKQKTLREAANEDAKLTPAKALEKAVKEEAAGKAKPGTKPAAKGGKAAPAAGPSPQEAWPFPNKNGKAAA